MPKASPRPKRARRAKKGSSRGTSREALAPSEENEDLPTELCLGTDGRIYVNAEGMDPAKIAGRKAFHGVAMTSEEAEIAVAELHKLAFNLTIAVEDIMRARRRRRGARKKKKKKAGETGGS